MSRTDSRSDLMALALRLRIWPAADGADGRSSSYIESLMQEAADAFDRLAASQPDREAMARAIEGIILRRMHEKRIEGYTLEMSLEQADAILPLLSGAGSGADTKSDGGCNCSWGCVEADNCRRKLGPLPDWKQDQSETSRIKPRPSDPSPGHEVKPAPIADSSEAGRGGSQALREVVVKYLHDGRLQTFEDRERFRKEARAALSAPVWEPVASLNASIDRFALAQARRIVEENAIPFATISGGYHRLDLPTAAYKALKEALYPHPPTPAVGADVREAWPEPKVTNPDIANPTGIPYIDGLIHQLLDAQQDINFAANTHMSQSLCDASALIDEVETAIRKLSALTRPLGGFVQGSIARKQSTDTEGRSRTETAGGEG